MFLFFLCAIALLLLIGIGAVWLVLHCMQAWANFLCGGGHSSATDKRAGT